MSFNGASRDGMVEVVTSSSQYDHLTPIFATATTEGSTVSCSVPLVATLVESRNSCPEPSVTQFLDTPAAPRRVHCRKPAVICATVYKPTSNANVGITVEKVHNVLKVSSVEDNSLFKQSPLRAGDEVVSVNRVHCELRDVAFVTSLIQRSLSTVFIVARKAGGNPNLVSVMITKPTPLSRVGIGFDNVGHSLRIATIDSSGLFAGTSLGIGDVCVSIEGISCDGLDLISAMNLLKHSRTTVTIVAKKDHPADAGPSLISAVATLEEERPNNEVSPALSKTLLYHEIMGTVPIVTTEQLLPHSRRGHLDQLHSAYANITVYKPTSSHDVGLSIGLVGKVLRVTHISSTGLFARSPLRLGDEVLTINHMSCADKDSAFVLDTIKKALCTVALVVRENGGDPTLVSTMITKPSPISRVGINLRGTGRDLRVACIDRKGLFSTSLVHAGDLVVSVEGISCSKMNSEYAEALIKRARSTVTILTKAEQRVGVVISAMTSIPRKTEPSKCSSRRRKWF